MSPFLNSSRRALRIQVACPVLLESSTERWSAVTEDVGALGFRLAIPAELDSGTSVRAALACPISGATIVVNARVVWSGRPSTWQVGIEFADGDRQQGQQWFDEVAACHMVQLPECTDGVPDRLPSWVRLRPGPARPPASPTEEEAQLLRLSNMGASLQEVRILMEANWPSAQRALFGMLSRHQLMVDADETKRAIVIGTGPDTGRGSE